MCTGKASDWRAPATRDLVLGLAASLGIPEVIRGDGATLFEVRDRDEERARLHHRD